MPAKKNLKSANIWQSYKQEGGCLVHFVRLATTLLKVEKTALQNLPFCPKLCQIFTDSKNSLADSAINLSWLLKSHHTLNM